MKMQKSWFYEEYGPKEVLKLGDLPIPPALENQLLVQVHVGTLWSVIVWIKKILMSTFLISAHLWGEVKPLIL